MATTATAPPAQSGSVDFAGVSVVTSSQPHLGQVGSAYNLTSVAASVPVWFHPTLDGRFLWCSAQTWSSATLGTDQGNYTSYNPSFTPTWRVLNPSTGATTPVPGSSGSAIPLLNPGVDPGSARLIGGASRAPVYLYLLHSVTVGGQRQALLGNYLLARNGSVSLPREETLPVLADPAVVFDAGVRYHSPFLYVYGTDPTGNIYCARKPWARLGTPTQPNTSQQTPRGVTSLVWEYWNGTGYGTDPTSAQPLSVAGGANWTTAGPMSFASHRRQLLASTVDFDAVSGYTGRLWLQRVAGRPSPLPRTAPLPGYLGSGIQLMPTLATGGSATQIPYVVSLAALGQTARARFRSVPRRGASPATTVVAPAMTLEVSGAVTPRPRVAQVVAPVMSVEVGSVPSGIAVRWSSVAFDVNLAVSIPATVTVAPARLGLSAIDADLVGGQGIVHAPVMHVATAPSAPAAVYSGITLFSITAHLGAGLRPPVPVGGAVVAAPVLSCSITPKPPTSYTSLGFTGLNNPYGIAVDSSDNIYVADYGGNQVYKMVGTTQTTFASLTGPLWIAL